jgi:hypothetical protein
MTHNMNHNMKRVTNRDGHQAGHQAASNPGHQTVSRNTDLQSSKANQLPATTDSKRETSMVDTAKLDGIFARYVKNNPLPSAVLSIQSIDQTFRWSACHGSASARDDSLLIAGTVIQIEKRSSPYQLMVRLVQAIRR